MRGYYRGTRGRRVVPRPAQSAFDIDPKRNLGCGFFGLDYGLLDMTVTHACPQDKNGCKFQSKQEAEDSHQKTIHYPNVVEVHVP